MAGEPHEPAAARPGTVLSGKYRVERELARGGMGVIVVATHLKLERQVAIKLLSLEGKDRAYVAARFLREARAVGALSGENVVRILDLDEAPDGTPFLVMELLDGVDLERLLSSEGKFAPGRAVDWVLQGCAALAEAHARDIVHRDVKPANFVLLRRLDGSELIKLLDFGISKILTDEVQLTRTASTLGSPLFMSPEQLLTPGAVDRRTDVWSLGVTLYQLLAGAPPFDAADASTVAAQIAARAPTPLSRLAPELPPELCVVVMRCLEKEAAARFDSVLALAEALEPFRSPGGLGSAASVRLASLPPRAAPPRPVEVPLAASNAPSWTLSHDVSRPAPSAIITAPPALVTVPAAAPAPRSFSVGTAVVVSLAALLGLAGFALTRPEPKQVAPAVVERPVVVVQPALPVPEAVAQPEPARDAGVASRVKPPSRRPTDPSELELK